MKKHLPKITSGSYKSARLSSSVIQLLTCYKRSTGGCLTKAMPSSLLVTPPLGRAAISFIYLAFFKFHTLILKFNRPDYCKYSCFRCITNAMIRLVHGKKSNKQLGWHSGSTDIQSYVNDSIGSRYPISIQYRLSAFLEESPAKVCLHFDLLIAGESFKNYAEPKP